MESSDNMSRWSDIMNMVKAGYKPGEIKELIELGKEVENEPETPDGDPEETPSEETETCKSDGEDWERKYNDLKTQLEKAQKKNSSEEVGKDTPSSIEEAEKALADLIRS